MGREKKDLSKLDDRVYDPAVVVRNLQTLAEITRRHLGWTQKEFAEAASISKAQLSHYMAGDHEPETATLARVASRLGVSTEWLIFGRGPVFLDNQPPPPALSRDRLLQFAYDLNVLAAALAAAVLGADDEGAAKAGRGRASGRGRGR